MTRRIVIAYWLIPAEPAHNIFQGMINNLALRYDAPVFKPHVTIHIGANHVAAAGQALGHAARKPTRIRLKPIGIDESEEFVKTLFVQFPHSTELQRLHEIIRNAAGDSSHYELKPHLSLLYKNMAAADRRELANSINMPFLEVTFDAMQAVCCVSPTQSRADVEAWHVIATEKLR